MQVRLPVKSGLLAPNIMEMASVSFRHLRLQARDHVALMVEAFPALPATVVATTKTEATLLLGHRSVPARILHRRPAVIEASVEGRRFRGEGRLAMASGRRGRVRDDTVVFHFGDSEKPLRRSYVRAPAIIPVTLLPIRADVPPAHALTIDISAGGALVRSPAPVGPGDELRVELQLPGTDVPIAAGGEVVRRTPDGLVGLRLDRMRPADRDLVTRWIAEQQAAARRRL